MSRIETVLGNTGCIVTGSMRIPFYRLDASDIVLMDSGFASEGDEIRQALDAAHCRVRAILTTHLHFDHVGNHSRFRRLYGAELYETLLDAGMSQNPLTLQCCFYTNSRGDLRREYPFMCFRPDHIILPEMETVTVDGAEFRLLRLPGHAHAQAGFVTPDDVAYLGDALLSPELLAVMPLAFFQCLEESLRSIDAAAAETHAAYILAHNGVYPEIREVAQSNRRLLLEKLDAVVSRLSGWTSRDMLTASLAGSKSHRSVLSLRQLQRIADGYIWYLEESGQLEASIQDGVLVYRRKPE